MNAARQSATGFWSIERFVAFVLGPSVTAGAGWLSTLLAKKWGIHLSGPEITGTFATGALAAAGLIYKWLHGRQLEMSLGQNKLVEGVVGSMPAREFLHTTLADLEGLAQNAASKALASVSVGSGQSPGVEIPPAQHDPAPAGQVGADGGAAPVE